MSTIQTQLSIIHLESSLNSSAAFQRSTNESSFSADAITVTGSDEAVSLGDIITPRQVFIKLVSGDPLRIGLASGNYPFRLTEVGECMLLSLDVDGRRETTTVVCGADSHGSLNGKYFELREAGDSKVWVWYDAGINASGTITYGVPVNGDTVTVDGTTFTCVASAPGANEFSNISELEALIEALDGINASENGTAINITAADPGAGGNSITLSKTGSALTLSGATLAGGADTGATPPTITTERLIPVVIAANSTDAQVATATAAALDADEAFICAVPTTATITIINAHTGTRTAADNGTTGWAEPTSSGTGAASDTIHLKSAGTSTQAVVSLAPA